MQQLNRIGRLLRARYVDTYRLIPANYSRSSVYVRSTNYDRTQLSSQALLQGLYPPGTGPVSPQNGLPGLTSHILQIIPVNTGTVRGPPVGAFVLACLPSITPQCA